jgi:hypothetical protein
VLAEQLRETTNGEVQLDIPTEALDQVDHA